MFILGENQKQSNKSGVPQGFFGAELICQAAITLWLLLLLDEMKTRDFISRILSHPASTQVKDTKSVPPNV